MPYSAREVVTAALATPLPCPVCGTQDCHDHAVAVDQRTDLIVAALVEHGHIPDPAAQPPPTDVEQDARDLATRSRYPRYTMTDGWRRLLQAAADVEIAYNQAVVAHPSLQRDSEVLRGRLLAHLDSLPPVVVTE